MSWRTRKQDPPVGNLHRFVSRSASLPDDQHRRAAALRTGFDSGDRGEVLLKEGQLLLENSTPESGVEVVVEVSSREHAKFTTRS
jgi:hypothetical protein